jgi:hypothetical protein
MEPKDQTQAFLASLPELKTGEQFRFACHPDVDCFNACCGDLTLMLTPYDALRLRKNLDLSSRDFITERAEVLAAPDTGVPTLRLNMQVGPKRPCPFVTRQGCSVYPDRPAACRTYPLGRATRLGQDGELIEQFFVVREDHCHGFAEDTDWTSATWLTDQGLEAYNAANDKLVKLLGRIKAKGRPLDQRQASMALLALYQPDRFQEFIRDMRLFERLEVTPERQAAIMADEEAALDFALDWLELVFFGHSDNLKKSGPAPEKT